MLEWAGALNKEVSESFCDVNLGFTRNMNVVSSRWPKAFGFACAAHNVGFKFHNTEYFLGLWF